GVAVQRGGAGAAFGGSGAAARDGVERGGPRAGRAPRGPDVDGHLGGVRAQQRDGPAPVRVAARAVEGPQGRRLRVPVPVGGRVVQAQGGDGQRLGTDVGAGLVLPGRATLDLGPLAGGAKGG